VVDVIFLTQRIVHALTHVITRSQAPGLPAASTRR